MMTTVAPPVTWSSLWAVVAFAVWLGVVLLVMRVARRFYVWLVATAITFGRADAR
jgi:hypothetical protein